MDFFLVFQSQSRRCGCRTARPFSSVRRPSNCPSSSRSGAFPFSFTIHYSISSNPIFLVFFSRMCINLGIFSRFCLLLVSFEFYWIDRFEFDFQFLMFFYRLLKSSEQNLNTLYNFFCQRDSGSSVRDSQKEFISTNVGRFLADVGRWRAGAAVAGAQAASAGAARPLPGPGPVGRQPGAVGRHLPLRAQAAAELGTRTPAAAALHLGQDSRRRRHLPGRSGRSPLLQ